MEVFDGKLLGSWAFAEAIVFWNLSEAKEYGCCNECEIIRLDAVDSLLALYVSHDLAEEENKF